jgi:two-component system sensor histidine kinase HydH
MVLGLKMTAFDEARQADFHHAIIMVAIVVALGAGALFFFFVIHNYYSVEKTLERTREQVRRAEKLAAIGKLAAGVAHEIRNPLGSIRGFAQFLSHVMKDHPEEREYADVMVREVDRINRVVSDLLTYARPLVPERTRANLQKLLDHTARLVDVDARARNVRITRLIPEDMPPLWLDPGQMTQALLNLLLNALQAIDENGHIEVGARLDRQTGLLRLWVEDDGKGIPADHLDKILDPFFTSRDKGTGLGLAIVHKIADNHHGDLHIESPPPGKKSGTCITLLIPGVLVKKKDAPS